MGLQIHSGALNEIWFGQETNFEYFYAFSQKEKKKNTNTYFDLKNPL